MMVVVVVAVVVVLAYTPRFGAFALKLYDILRQIIFSMWKKTSENVAERWESLLL